MKPNIACESIPLNASKNFWEQDGGRSLVFFLDVWSLEEMDHSGAGQG